MNPGNGLGSFPIVELFQKTAKEISWDDYSKWLLANKQKSYANKLFRYSKKYWEYGFSDRLVLMDSSRTRLEIMKAVSNLTRYLDISNDTNIHEEFTKWLKRKELHWSSRKYIDNYTLGKKLNVNDVVEKLRKIPVRYSNFGFFMLVTGLRTSEGLKAFNNHSDLCHDGIMELFWDRKTKKANAVYCHPLIHDEIKHTISRKVYYHITKKALGFDLRDLRKLNFTINAMKIDPLLAEFMQGRRGNVSQRHYFLPMMSEHRKKWIKTWNPIIQTRI
ncbi:hypothetical protein [Candidatus Nitrosotenuis uzonensis]|uniref:Integrase SSV1 C-terminal domain-containing protein n=1 Tax=Candidatus Nitrosotenuis uzonensis TaxID=1407055 RepID=V6AQD9_9ARCH|nr:hypothetical protein [Candidatus Nitrosotenuis uzonensis]CDI04951.1 conserved hypothetical protein [Candidatus Nitrosotenuis uzonensis]